MLNIHFKKLFFAVAIQFLCLASFAQCPGGFTTSVSPSTATVCSGSSVSLTAAAGAISYLWSTGQTSSVISATPTVSTSYTVTATDSVGCSASATALITAAALPSVSISPASPATCPGAAVTLTASGSASTYTWSNGATTSSITVNPTSTTIYSVLGNGGGCSNSASVTVTVNSLPSIGINTGLGHVCSGGTDTITASGGVAYLWSTGATTAAIVNHPTVTTSYTVTATGSNGCSATTTASIPVYGPATVSPGSASSCPGSAVVLTANGGTSYGWSTGATSQSITVAPTTTTTYRVTATNSYGCAGVDSTQATVTTTPTVVTVATSPSNGVSCSGATVTLTASGASTYVWSTGATTASISVTPVNTTTYTVTGTANGCTGTATSTITVYGHAVITQTYTTICAGSAVTLGATMGTGSHYLWSTGDTTATIAKNPTTTTTYTVTVTPPSATGCLTSSATATVTVNALPAAAISPASATICAGSSATLTATGGTSYIWNFGSNTVVQTLSPAVTTTYSITATNAAGCTASASATITVNSLPALPVTVSASRCGAGSVTLSATGAGTNENYNWYTAVTGGTLVQSGGATYTTPSLSANTTYYVTKFNTVTGCEGGRWWVTAIIYSGVPAAPTISAGSALTCTGFTANWGLGSTSSVLDYRIDVATDAGFSNILSSWNNVNAGYTSSEPITGLTAGVTYYYRVRAENACGVSASSNAVGVTTASSAVPVSAAATNVACSSFTANWAAASGASSYIIDVSTSATFATFLSGYNGVNVGNASAVTIGGLSVGSTYYYRVRSTNGCFISSNSAVQTVTTTASGACYCSQYGSATATAAITNVTFNTINFTNLTRSAGYVDYSGSLSTAVSPSNVYSLSVSVNSGGANTVYAKVWIDWNENGVFDSTEQYLLGSATNVTNGITNLSPLSITVPAGALTGSTIMRVEVKNGAYGSPCDTGIVGQVEDYKVVVGSCSTPPSITVTPASTTVCAGQAVTLTASGGSSYQWSNGATTASLNLNPSSTGTYIVTGTSSPGCSATASSTITVNGTLTATLTGGSTPICYSTSAGTLSVSATGGIGTYTYQWYNSSGTIAGATSTTYAVPALTASNSYYCIVTASTCGSATSATKTIAVYANLSAAISGGSSPICYNSSPGTLTATGAGATGAYTYQWYNSSGAISGATASTYAVASLTANNSYYCAITSGSCGTVFTATTAITVYPASTLTVSGGTSPVCAGGSPGTFTALAAGGSGSYTYQWYNAAGSITGATASTYAPGAITANNTYHCVQTGSCGVSSSNSIVITVNAAPSVYAYAADSSICNGSSVVVAASATPGSGTISGYLWSQGSTTSSITVSPTAFTTYNVTVTNSNGCTASGTTFVSVTPRPSAPVAGNNSPIVIGHPIDLTATTIAGASYQWTGPNGFTSTQQNPVISSATTANAGVYTVVALVNGCSSLAAATNVAINAFTLFMDTVSVNPGSQAVVLVRVLNFTMMLSAQSTIHFDTAKLQFVQTQQYGINTLTSGNFGTTQAVNGNIVFTWSDPNLAGVSLPNDSTFFALLFNVRGALGSSTPLTFTNTLAQSEFVDTSVNTINYVLNPGEVIINGNDTISGKIESELGYGVQGTTVTASGTPTYTDVTDTSGKYSFNLLPGSSYTVTPTKSNDSTVTNGITTLDYLLVQRHILGTTLLNTPYKIIAADVNSSGTVTSLDLLYIRALILGNITSFPGGKLWAFVPASYTFSNPLNPFPFPTSLSYSSVTQQNNQNFIGIKLGDVNDSWNPLVKSLQSSKTVNLMTPEMTALPGGEISVPIRASNFKQISGMQFTMEWDPSILKFSSVDSTSGALTVSYGESKTSAGLLSIQWTDPNYASTTIADDSVLFYIAFKVTGQPGETSPMAIVSKITAIEIVDNDLNELGFNVNNGAVKITSATAVNSISGIKDPGVAVMPNPFTEHTQLSFELYNAGDVKIEIYNELGQLVTTYDGNYGAGKHQIEIGNNWSSGLYFVRFSTGDYITTLRIANTTK